GSFFAGLGFRQVDDRRRTADGRKNVGVGFGRGEKHSHFFSGSSGGFSFFFQSLSFPELADETVQSEEAWWRRSARRRKQKRFRVSA
ncbi:MAG: hypothetical protein ACK56F_02500, partial [bacterium]